MLITTQRVRREIQSLLEGQTGQPVPPWLEPLASFLGEGQSRNLAVANASVKVANHVSGLGQGALSFDSRIRHLVEQIQALAAAIEEMSASAQEVGGLGQQVLEQAGGVHENARESLAALDDMEAHLRRIDKALEEANEQMRTLAEDTSRIEALTNSVNEISDQTNLLALNAAIEAARAGDAGRGFAVVADEVRQLASRSSAAGVEINNLVARIVSGSESVQTKLIASVDAVQSSTNSRERVSTIIHRSREAADRNVELATQIAAAASQQSDVSGDMARQVNSNSDDADVLAGIFEELIRAIQPLRDDNLSIFEHLGPPSPALTLALAKRDHVVWIDRLIRYAIFGDQTMSADEVKDHTQCRLGKFLDSDQGALVRNMPDSRELVDVVHPQVHRLGKQLFDAAASYHQGKLNQDRYLEAANSLADQLRVLSGQVVDHLNKAIAEVH